MRKANAAEAQGQKPESRFAILTSGLLARKGAAAPSNAPVADPAEETTAFAIEPASRQPAPPPPRQTRGRAAEAAVAAPVISPSMTVINERSAEAGYPDNPTPEELEAFLSDADAAPAPDAPIDAGFDDAPDAEEDALFGEPPREPPEPSPFDPEDAPLAAPAPLQGRSIEMPVPRPAGLGERRAAVTFRMTTRDFLRLKLGAAEMNMTAQDVILEALEEFLDARGVESLRGCACLEKSAALLCGTPCADAAERE